jgi:predicted metal-dependent hydrolase
MVSLLEFTCSAGRKFPVEVRRRKGTRHLRLRLNVHNCIVVSMPWHGSDRSCLKFIDQNRQWLERQINAAPEVISVREWLQQSPWLTAAGRSFAVTIKEAFHTRRAYYRIEAEEAGIGLHLPVQSEGDALSALVRKFARESLAGRVAEQAERFGLNLSKVSVRDQSSRWGSCSSRKTISINWRLVLIPPRLQDYVICHELAHLTEMNHSRRFWNLLESYDPDRREHELELDARTPQIMRVRAVGVDG